MDYVSFREREGALVTPYFSRRAFMKNYQSHMVVMNPLKMIRSFHDFVYSTRTLSLLVLVPAMNMLIIAWSVAFEPEAYEGYMPLMWLGSTTLAVLTAYEYRAEKRRRLEQANR